ncbi:MAG TPA: histidine kinase, partial [Candidatus Nitrosotenuis sp.]|nr:histidine kinase [Candidatus Nitrosotenuis sp.]
MAGASAAEQLEAVAERRLKRWLRAGGGAGLALAALLGVLVGLLPALLVAFLSTTAALGALLGLARRQKGRAEARARLAGERLQAALEEERAHLARELHDELGQYLTVMAMDLSRLEESLAEQDPARERVEALAAALQHCLARLRRLAWELAPRSLDLGLPAALEWEARRLGRRTG